MNHGAGRDVAIENTCEHFTGERSLADFAKRHGLAVDGLAVESVQGSLL